MSILDVSIREVSALLCLAKESILAESAFLRASKTVRHRIHVVESMAEKSNLFFLRESTARCVAESTTMLSRMPWGTRPSSLRPAESQRTRTGTASEGRTIRKAPDESMTALSRGVESAARAVAMPACSEVTPLRAELEDGETPPVVASWHPASMPMPRTVNPMAMVDFFM